MATPDRKSRPPSELRKEVGRSREYLARDIERLRDELDFPKKIRRSFERRPAAWIAGVSIAGLAVTALLFRKRKTRSGSQNAPPPPKSGLVQAGFMLGVLRIAANLLKPHVEAFVARKIRGYGSGSREK